MRKKTISSTLIFLIIICGSLSYCSIQLTNCNPVIPIRINIKGIALAVDPFPDYINFVKQDLSRLGFIPDVEIFDYEEFYYKLMKETDYDFFIFEISSKKSDIDFSDLFGTNGCCNFFGYEPSLDWNESSRKGLNDQYLTKINCDIETNSTERRMFSWEWQKYLTDRICPMKPLFAFEDCMVYWNNLKGYIGYNGLLESWGKMWWDGHHENQDDTSEIVIADHPWIELNPLFQYDPASTFISSACLDPLFWSEGFNFPIENNSNGLYPHLIENYNVFNDTYIRLKCREGIKWQRDPSGKFENEYLDVEDIYFTLCCWKYLSKSKHDYYWLKKMEIIDDYTLDIFIDADPSTAVCESFAPALTMLNVLVLPEHFLNQTQVAYSVLPNIAHQSWTEFSSNCFGTGLFQIYNSSLTETNLQVFYDCWWLNTSITYDTALNFEERFGTFDHGLTNLLVRIISDQQTEFLEFEAGKIDIVNAGYFENKKDQYLDDSDFELQEFNSSNLVFLGFNLRESREYIGSREIAGLDPTSTIGLSLRKSICYGVDRKEISNVLHDRKAIFTNHPIYTSFGNFCYPYITQYNYNLDKARQYYENTSLYEVWIPPNTFELWQKVVMGISFIPGIVILVITKYFFNKKRRRGKKKQEWNNREIELKNMKNN